MNIISFPYEFLISILISLIITPFVIKIAYKFDLIDDPRKHKHPAIIHKLPIARGGGLAIYISILLTSIFFLTMNYQFAIILISGFLVVAVGLLDDKYDLSPYVRFIANIVLVSFVVFAGISIPFITNPFGGILDFKLIGNSTFLIPQILAILWIVWVMNMLNWSKGVDGQMPGIAAISAIVIGVASLRFPSLDATNIFSAELSFIVAGAALGFLFYNLYPAKIFPGYSATVLGFFIGILSILSGVKLATAVLVMGIPTVDAALTVTRRIFSKKSPFWHDKGHLHHILLDLGLSQRSIAVFYWIMCLVLGFIALNLGSKGKLFAIILLIVLVGGGILTLKFILKKSK